MKIVNLNAFEFRFSETVDAFIFDETDCAKPTYHGAPMKAVDIVVELEKAYLYVEVKNYDTSLIELFRKDASNAGSGETGSRINWLKNYLKYKFRDTYLYRHAEQKTDKPIHYICVINFNNGMNSALQRELTRELPVGRVSRRWTKSIAVSCQVVNVEKWNQLFPNWRISYTN